MELISPVLRTDFREFCVSNLVLRQINDLFTMAGIRRGTVPADRAISGQRRTLVEEYYASLNWHIQADSERFLKVLGFALVQSSISDEQRIWLRKLCEREGLMVDGVHLRIKTGRPSTTSHASVAAEELARFATAWLTLPNWTLRLAALPWRDSFRISLKLTASLHEAPSDSLASRSMAAFN